jgi:hypothetical protein
MEPGGAAAIVRAMDDLSAQRITWRRSGVRRPYVGTLSASTDGIVLTGRDSVSGFEVMLSIPLEEVEEVRASRSVDEQLGGECSVVLQLAESDSILLRGLGIGSSRVHALVRRLDALTAAPALTAQGG